MYHVFRIHPFIRLFWAMLMALAGLILVVHAATPVHVLEGLALLATSVWIVLGILRRARAYLSTWHG